MLLGVVVVSCLGLLVLLLRFFLKVVDVFVLYAHCSGLSED